MNHSRRVPGGAKPVSLLDAPRAAYLPRRFHIGPTNKAK